MEESTETQEEEPDRYRVKFLGEPGVMQSIGRGNFNDRVVSCGKYYRQFQQDWNSEICPPIFSNMEIISVFARAVLVE